MYEKYWRGPKQIVDKRFDKYKPRVHPGKYVIVRSNGRYREPQLSPSTLAENYRFIFVPGCFHCFVWLNWVLRCSWGGLWESIGLSFLVVLEFSICRIFAFTVLKLLSWVTLFMAGAVDYGTLVAFVR